MHKRNLLVFALMIFLASSFIDLYARELHCLNSVGFGLDAFSISTLNSNGSKRKKSKKKSGSKTRVKKSDNKSGIKMLNGDFFIGPTSNIATGNFIELQRLFYESGSDKFPTEFTSKNFIWFTAGGAIRINPFADSNPYLAYLGFSLGVSYFQRGFSSSLRMQNLNLDYTDETIINESFNANYLSNSILVRYGNKIYIEGGVTIDWFLNGNRTYELKRATSGENAYEGSFETFQKQPDEKLSSEQIKNGGIGFCMGLGYNITKAFGLKVNAHNNSMYFTSGANISNLQLSALATILIN